MSHISTINKNSAHWKLSGTGRPNNLEQSRLYPTYNLPEKFSPSKGTLNNSRLFNSSIEKLKFSKIQSPNERSTTPKKQSVCASSFPSHQSLKDSNQMQRSETLKSLNNRKNTLQSKLSCTSISQELLAQIRLQIMKELTHQYEQNRKLIIQLKEQFHRFKKAVYIEMTNQKNIMVQAIDEITKKIDQSTKNNQKIKVTTIEETDIRKNYFSEVFEKQKLEDNQSIIQFINKPITTEYLQNYCALPHPFETEPQQSKTVIIAPQQPQPLPLQTVNDIPASPVVSTKPKGDSPNIQKCTHLVQTINILSELNDSPIEKVESPEKGIIQQCKQKALMSIKSNDNLYKQKIKARDSARQQVKVKGNFKLDKFYSAIEKLKEEVNEIRHISDIKQTKNGRIIKTYQ